MFGSVIWIRLLSKVISQSNNDEWSFYTQYTAIRPDWWATKWKKNPGYWQKYPETQTTPKKPRSSGKNPAVATLTMVRVIVCMYVYCAIQQSAMSTQAKYRAAMTTVHIASSSSTRVLRGTKPASFVHRGMRHCRRRLTTTSFRSSWVQLMACTVHQSGLTLTLAMLTTLATGTGSTHRRQVLTTTQ